MTALILPDKDFCEDYYQRTKDIINEKFNDGIISFALDTSKDLYKKYTVNYLNTTNNELFLTKSDLLSLINKYNLNRFVILRRENNTNPNISWEQLDFPFYRDINGGQSGIRPVNNTYVFEKDRDINKTFSRTNNTSLLNDTRMLFFPYNYFQNVDDVSKVDQFGFRTNEKINKSKKLIIILGGSGGHDLNSLDRETLSRQVSDLISSQYQVLNYSLPGYVLLNEMILYILIIKKLKPYMIITYDGINDFLNGIQNDKNLISKYDLNYTHYLEKITTKIYNKDLINRQPADLKDVAVAYIERKKQFEELLNNDNIKYVSILQPFVYSKSALSIEEINSQKDTYLDIYKQISNGYELLNNIPIKYHLDLHIKFNNYDETYTLFSDSIYQLPLANTFIAKEISNFLTNRNLI